MDYDAALRPHRSAAPGADSAAFNWRCTTKTVTQPGRPLTSDRMTEGEGVADTKWDELYERYRALLRRAVHRVCPPELGASCDDIEQEAWVSVWNVLKGEREIEYPASYIYKVGVSAAIRAIRRSRARREDSLQEENAATGAQVHTLYAPPGASPHAVAERRECREKIATALAGLPENRRLAVGLHLRGLTTPEIGKLLEWSEPKARNLVHRGLKDLRASLRGMGIEDGS
jgi:RNA polymerase sigma factor (sigma-70 family)